MSSDQLAQTPVTAPLPAPVPAYRPEVDGLRAISVISVILFHSGLGSFSRGFLGVDVFFVISGYLITGFIHVGLQTGEFRLRDFYARRARRILPALLFVMLCCAVPAWLWMDPYELRDFSMTSIATVFSVSNFYLWSIGDYFQPQAIQNPLLHSWSLSVEEQFYLVFPPVIIVLWRYRPRWLLPFLIVVALVSLGISEWGWRHTSAANYYVTPSRVWELLAGAICALVLLQRRLAANDMLSFIGLAAVLISLFAPGPDWPAPSVYTLIPIMGTMLIIVFGTQGSAVHRLLSRPFLVGIGLMSYSAYLWHLPLFAFLHIRMLDGPSYWMLVSAIAVTFVLAWGTWRWVEQPFRHRTTSSAEALRPLMAIASMAVAVVTLAGAAVVTDGAAMRMSEQVRTIAAYDVDELIRTSSRCTSTRDIDTGFANACRLGARGGIPSVALLGDSHAHALVPMLDRALTRRGLTGIGVMRAGCPPMMLRPDESAALESECGTIRDVLSRAVREPSALPHTLIISSRWQYWLGDGRLNYGEGDLVQRSGTSWNNPVGAGNLPGNPLSQMADSIRAMLNSGRRVILVYPVPEMTSLVPSRLSKLVRFNGGIDAASASTSYALYRQRAGAVTAAMDSLGNYPNLVRVRTDRFFCNSFVEGRCVAHIDGRPLYVDTNHIADKGAAILVDAIMAGLER